MVNNSGYRGLPMVNGLQLGVLTTWRSRQTQVEGANLFLSDGARIALENAGVHVFKDASTNKARRSIWR